MNTVRHINAAIQGLLRPLRELKVMQKAKREASSAFSHHGAPPILIYQMGKVGSSTICKSLAKASIPNPVLHLHFLSRDLPGLKKVYRQAGLYMSPYHFYLGEATRKVLDRHPDIPIKIISPLREPIAFVISDLFQNPHFAKDSLKTDASKMDPQKVLAYLDSELRKPGTFSYVYEWFDRELKTVFDIDVLGKPFPVETGYAVYSKGKVEVLVLRFEDLAEKWPKVIAEFLGLEAPLVLARSNVRSESDDAATYQEVLGKLCLSPSLCREIYSSSFARHFYSEAMISQFISKWARGGNAQEKPK